MKIQEVTARELAGGSKPTLKELSESIVNFIRGCTRPVLTFTGLYSCVCLQATQGDCPLWLISFTGTMLLFWFGEKFVNRIKG